jgi:hypothetical protein
MIQCFGAMRTVVMAGVIGLTLASASFSQTPQAPAAPGVQPARGPQAPTPPCGPGLSDVKNVAADSRCFELRTYTVDPAGPGSLDLLHARFRNHTTALFRKHGMTIIGFWHPTNKPNALVYLLAYKDRAARDAAWAGFNVDPEWVKVRTAMNVRISNDGLFMSATDYSPMK